MSAKVTDGWSLRALRKMLHVSPSRLGNPVEGERDSAVKPNTIPL